MLCVVLVVRAPPPPPKEFEKNIFGKTGWLLIVDSSSVFLRFNEEKPSLE